VRTTRRIIDLLTLTLTDSLPFEIVEICQTKACKSVPRQIVIIHIAFVTNR
jgi:hypothetical protein